MIDGQFLAIGLGLLSAVSLAVVNVVVKRGGDILVTRAMLSGTAALIIAPAAFLVPFPNPATWAALGVAVPVHFLYQAALIRAMHRGDLSLVFPIMRGLAPLLTACAAFLVLGEALSIAAVIGLLVATGAVIVFALPPANVRLGAHPDVTALFWAAITAIGVALYNVADARGMRIAPDPFTYIVWLFLLDWIFVGTTAVFVRKSALFAAIRSQWRYGFVAGALSIVSFGSALYAFTLMEAAKVAALRETAIVFAAIMGGVFLKEGTGRRRTLAAIVLAAGLITMQVTL
ncbi:MAG: DMT family transporter [Pseudomonadota bacterium]